MVKPPLSPAQCQNRLRWARAHSRDHFSNVLWSDETSIPLRGPPKKVWRLRGEEVNTPYAPHQITVNIWGSIGPHGTGDLFIYEQTLNGKLYTRILQEHLLHSAQHACPPRWRFMQDNLAAHLVQPARAFLQQNNVNVIKWPAYSPDLNPIENVWADLKHRVWEAQPTTKAELIAEIHRQWANLSQPLMQKYCGSVPHRIQQVIAHGGKSINK
jgi:transposase